MDLDLDLSDPNVTLWNDAPPDAGDKALAVRFFLHPRLNRVKTYGQPEEKDQFGRIVRERVEPAGRPIFEDVEYISIAKPGDRLDNPVRPATPADKKRFRAHYQAFKEGLKDVTIGTPLSRWPLISAAQVEELKFFNIRTVEQLALMPDGNIPNVGNISHLKKHAQDFLELAKGTAPTVALRAELEKRDAQMDALQKQLQEQSLLIARLASQAQAPVYAQPVAAPAAAPKRQRGRPAKKPQAEEVANGDV